MKDLHTLDKYRDRDFGFRIHGGPGDAGNGAFKVYVRKRATPPTWAEMCEIKHMFFEDEEVVVQYHPPKSEYVNNHPYCLHLWRPTSQEMPRPPKIFV